MEKRRRPKERICQQRYTLHAFLKDSMSQEVEWKCFSNTYNFSLSFIKLNHNSLVLLFSRRSVFSSSLNLLQ